MNERTPPKRPSVDLTESAALLRRALKQLAAWQTKYGDADPQWLPPAGDVRLAEDIDEYLGPTAPQREPVSPQIVSADYSWMGMGKPPQGEQK